MMHGILRHVMISHYGLLNSTALSAEEMVFLDINIRLLFWKETWCNDLCFSFLSKY